MPKGDALSGLFTGLNNGIDLGLRINQRNMEKERLGLAKEQDKREAVRSDDMHQKSLAEIGKATLELKVAEDEFNVLQAKRAAMPPAMQAQLEIAQQDIIRRGQEAQTKLHEAQAAAEPEYLRLRNAEMNASIGAHNAAAGASNANREATNQFRKAGMVGDTYGEWMQNIKALPPDQQAKALEAWGRLRQGQGQPGDEETLRGSIVGANTAQKNDPMLTTQQKLMTFEKAKSVVDRIYEASGYDPKAAAKALSTPIGKQAISDYIDAGKAIGKDMTAFTGAGVATPVATPETTPDVPPDPRTLTGLGRVAAKGTLNGVGGIIGEAGKIAAQTGTALNNLPGTISDAINNPGQSAIKGIAAQAGATPSPTSLPFAPKGGNVPSLDTLFRPIVSPDGAQVWDEKAQAWRPRQK